MTQAQVKQARDAAFLLMQTANQLYAYTNYVNAQFDNGFVLQVSQSTTTYAMPASMAADVVDLGKYNALKNSLIAEFGQLP